MRFRHSLRSFARQLALVALLVVVTGIWNGGQWSGSIASAAAPGSDARHQEDGNRAGLVIRFDDSHVVTKCVSFTETEITGEELLEKSGLATGIGADGRLCSIDNQGCPSDDCWCRCPFPECEYWAYYHLVNDAWVYSNLGAAWSTVENATVQGWSWGAGDTTTGVEPPLHTFEEICSTISSASAATTPAAPGETPRSGPEEIPGLVTLLLLGGGAVMLVVYARRAKK